MPSRVSLVLLFVCGLALAACDSAEDRAQTHFERSKVLLAEGDVPRAIVELRNVFQLNATHREARLLFAQVEEDRSNPAGAYAQYRSVTEVSPEDLDAQVAAARLAADLGDWQAAERHAQAAREMLGDEPGDPALQAVELGVAYQAARRGQDLDTAGQLAQDAATLLADHPELRIARQVLVDNQMLRQDWSAALNTLDGGVAQHPELQQLYMLRLAVLEQLGDTEAIETQLRDMVDRFPDDPSLSQTLTRWYIAQNRMEDAENYLRAQADQNRDKAEPRMVLVSFLRQTRGTEAARDELVQVVADTPADDPNYPTYRAAKAGFDFDLGQRAEAIAEVQEILEGAEPSEETRRIKIVLASMYTRSSNPVGARALVEEILVEDPSEVEALKMRAAWLIEDDKPDEALVDLRTALDQSPRNASIFTLMAQAQQRAGSQELMGEMLALAAEASNNAPDEALRYANYLAQDGRLLAAENVLIDALRVRGGNVQLLQRLGRIYVELEDWGRLQGVIEALNGQDAELSAKELTASMMAARNQEDQLQTFLEELADSETGNNRVIAAAINLRLSQGDVQGAFDFLQERLAEAPDDPDLRFINARVLVMLEDQDTALVELRSLTDEVPDNERYWITLYRLTRLMDGPEASTEVLSQALAQLPDSRNLLWMQASELEFAGDIDGAIGIYETLYDENSSSVVVANNLASLISQANSDPESIDRAYAIARRLRGTDVPAFQDTYGWIAAQRGNVTEALEYLEPAAESLPQDPTVQYHLARTYVMAGQDEKALAAFQASLEAINARDTSLPFKDTVETEIARLTSPPAEN